MAVYDADQPRTINDWPDADPRGEAVVTTADVADLLPSPENDLVYRPADPADPADPEFAGLVASVAEFGVLDRIVVTLDQYIVSGHRRHAAAKAAGRTIVPVTVLPIRRCDDIDAFVRLLREHNRSRVKTDDERVREELLDVDRDDVYAELKAYRLRKSAMSDFSGTAPVLAVGDQIARKAISAAKSEMVRAVVAVLNDRRDYWPLSDRSIHYALLNAPPLRHARKPGSRYANDLASYKDVCDLLTRLRLAGQVPWSAIADDTRPFTSWQVFGDAGAFVGEQSKGFLAGYARDLLQSQPCHVEVLAEKLTIKRIVESVTADYCVPSTVGRGYSSIQPRHALAERFQRSGRDRLVLLVLSDHDPEGESIAESFARSLRDDFQIDESRMTAMKVALGPEQVRRFNLPPAMKAKTTSSRYAAFSGRHGDDVWELEALPPATLASELRRAIEGVLDLGAFERERQREADDACYLEGLRRTVLRSMGPMAVPVEGNPL